MKLSILLFLNEKNLQTGIEVQFKEIDSKFGKAMSLITKDGERYIIAASLDNFNRFKNWNGKKSVADILPSNKKIKTSEGTFPLVKLRTDVEIDAKFRDVADRDDEGNMVF